MPKLAQILEQSSGTRQVCVSVFILFWSLYKANRFHVTVRLFSNRSQRTSKCGKNTSDTLACSSCATSLFLPHFDVIGDLLLNRRTATWNLFVKYTTCQLYSPHSTWESKNQLCNISIQCSALNVSLTCEILTSLYGQGKMSAKMYLMSKADVTGQPLGSFPVSGLPVSCQPLRKRYLEGHLY